MRRDLFTAAKACLALGTLAAVAMIFAPLPKGSLRYAAARDQRLSSSTEPQQASSSRSEQGAGKLRRTQNEATATASGAPATSTESDVESSADVAPQLAATEAAASPLQGLKSLDSQILASSTAAVTFEPAEETPIKQIPIAELVPEPTEDPFSVEHLVESRRHDEIAAEVRDLKEIVQRLAQASPAPPAAPVGSESSELRKMIDDLKNAERFRTLEAEIQRLRGGPGTTAPANEPVPAPGAPSSPGRILVTQPKRADQTEQPDEPFLALPTRDLPSVNESDVFSLQVEAAELTQVLNMLGEMAGWNVVAGPTVTGTVTLNLRNVTLDEALNSILTPRDLVAERKDNLLFVSSRAEAVARTAAARVLVTKVYRPNYLKVQDLETLITPLLTPEIGKVSVTTPTVSGLQLDAEIAGGNDLAQQDALLVQDYPEVTQEIDEIVLEMDVPPMQVVIEAYVLQVRLADNMRFGVNFAILNNSGRQLVSSGSPATLATSVGLPGQRESLIPPAAQFLLPPAAGLRYGFLTGDVTGFIEALEGISETSLVASPKLRVLNKQKAELIIGQRLGYKTQTFNNQQTIENVQFLDVGTKLVLRPFAAPDGLIRMEIHPERSSGIIDENGLPRVDTTEVTTNVMVRDGTTVVVGGLIDEQTEEDVTQIPLLGSIPVVGYVFRNTEETLVRNELIVLITPRIVCDPIEEMHGEVIKAESEYRASNFTDTLSPISRRNLARLHKDRAAALYEEGRLVEAHDHARHALSVRKNDGEALQLKTSIEGSLKQRAKRFFFWNKSTSEPVPPVITVPDEEEWLPPPEGNGHVVLPTEPMLVPPAPEPEPTLAPSMQP